MSCSRTVLCIDYDPINNEIVTDFLEDQYSVICVINGKQVLYSIELIKPDLILLDILMPVMNGGDTLKHLKTYAKTKDIPVIIISVLSHTKEIEYMIKLDADKYITKPFRQMELKKEITTWVGKS